jgi:amidohydrolase
VALRADMDALPVTEPNTLPFFSQVRLNFNGVETGVMHACGHDAHMAILLSTAEVFSKMKKEIPGTIKFIFQPAEEGPPTGEDGGSALMVKEGVLKSPDVDVIFGLHIAAGKPTGTISYKPEGTMAASDRFIIKIIGKQAHGSTPWLSVDPIATATQIITGLQTIISRQTELTKEAAVISVGKVDAGIRYNIIPEEATITGTIRTLDASMQTKIHELVRLKATKIAESMGATVEVDIKTLAPLTYNDPELTAMMIPSLQKAAGATHVELVKAITGAEDFSVFQQNVPGLYFFVGAKPENNTPETGILESHHTPDFYIEEGSMITGLKAMLNLTLDYMQMHQK